MQNTLIFKITFALSLRTISYPICYNRSDLFPQIHAPHNRFFKVLEDKYVQSYSISVAHFICHLMDVDLLKVLQEVDKAYVKALIALASVQNLKRSMSLKCPSRDPRNPM